MNTTKIILLALVAILISSCTIQEPEIPSNRVSVTAQPIITPHQTAKPIHSLTIVPALTWTPLPTLSAQDANTKIRVLLETNGGCELPCWWGITPNKTNWAETLQSLSPFITDLKQGSTNEVSENGKTYNQTNFIIYYRTPKNESAEIWFSIRDELVLHMAVFSQSTQYKYQLHQILSNLGMPKQVYIVSPPIYLKPEFSPTKIILDYSDVGIWASYSYIPSVIGEGLLVCPQPVGPRLELDDPTISNAYLIPTDELLDTLGEHTATARKIEEVTKMNTENFYTTFVDPTTKACLEISANVQP